MLAKIAILLEMIKFKHTVFALPFALMGAFLAAGGVPGWRVFIWVVVGMAGARTAAMGFNRIVDRKFDAHNPRTANRAIPAGDVRLGEAWAMVLLAAALFFFACAQLNQLTLAISPFALALTFLYSLTKRFTWLCHVVLGVALAFSPVGGYVAVLGNLHDYPWVLSLGVLLWVAGFDMVYACLDADFDKGEGLYSMPVRFGAKKAFLFAKFFHAAAFLCFIAAGLVAHLNLFFFCGIVLAGAALVYQHILVNPNDLGRIQLSFFTMNGCVSVVLFLATWLSLTTS